MILVLQPPCSTLGPPRMGLPPNMPPLFARNLPVPVWSLRFGTSENHPKSLHKRVTQKNQKTWSTSNLTSGWAQNTARHTNMSHRLNLRMPNSRLHSDYIHAQKSLIQSEISLKSSEFGAKNWFLCFNHPVLLWVLPERVLPPNMPPLFCEESTCSCVEFNNRNR